MSSRTVNWLVFTCLIGLIPVISRLLLWLNSNSGIDLFSTSDFVAFGLVLHSSNIQEVSAESNPDARWKSIHIGTSAIFIVLYGLILFTTIAQSPNIDKSSLQISTFLLCVVSFFLSFSIFYERYSESSSDRNDGDDHA
jgi:hypothetical protein